MFTLFAVGTLWFWLVSSIFIVLGITFVENDSPVLTLFDLIGLGLFLEYVAKFHFFGFLIGHPAIFVLGILGYVLLGAGWSLLKWKQYVRAKVEAYDKSTKEDYWKNKLLYELNVGNNKGEFTFWLSYWPLSLTWACIHQPVRKFYNFMYNRLKAGYQGIANSGLRQAGIDPQ